MRIQRLSTAGKVSTGTMTVMVVLAVLVGVGAVLFLRSPRRTPPAPSPAGPIELSRTNLVLSEGRLRPTGSATPFSGVMLEHYPAGNLRSRSAISNGVLHGLSEGWYTNAQIQVAEQFREGVSHGRRLKWYATGTNQSEAQIVAGQLHGTYRKWHENGALAEQVEFVEGKPHGVAMSYFPSGFWKARVVMTNGQPAEQTFWKDGEKKE